MSPGTGGGSAAAGGLDYQARCAAWFMGYLLAMSGAAPQAELWTGPLVRVECETDEPVDDIRITPHVGAPVVVQCKHRLTMQSSPQSELASVVRQFVMHHRAPRNEHDRLVLCTTSRTGHSLRTALPTVLKRLRDATDTDAAQAAHNEAERKVLAALTAHMQREWEAAAGLPPTVEQIRGVLEQTYVLVLDVDPGGADEGNARLILRTLIDPASAADAAWDSLITRAARLAAERSGTDRASLQAHLVALGFRLVGVVDFAPDVARLEQVSQREINALAGALVTIPSPTSPIRIDRCVVDDIIDAGNAGPLLVVGDPGSGKTVALHRLAVARSAAGLPTLFLPVGSFTATSTGDLRVELGLDHDLRDVLVEWAPGVPKVIVVDAYDAARGDARAGLWQRIIRDVSALGDWHVVASVRTWDLEHSASLKSQFPDPPVLLGELSDAELDATVSSWPELAQLVLEATDDLRALLRNPFNLRLAADLLLAGATRAVLADVTKRVDLLTRYWMARVADDPGGVERDTFALNVARGALASKSLTVPTVGLIGADRSAGSVLDQLLSRAVLADASIVPAPTPAAVRFAHHVLFDFAVSLTFAATVGALTAAIDSDPNLMLFARPSVELHLHRAWLHNRGTFWAIVLSLAAGGPGTRLAVITAAQVTARNSESLDDLAALLDSVANGDASEIHLQVLRYVALAVVLDREDDQRAPVGAWPKVAERLSTTPQATELPLRILLGQLVAEGTTLIGEDLIDTGVAARRWLTYCWSIDPGPLSRLAIEAVITTAASDPAATEALLRTAIDPGQLISRGAHDLPGLCGHVATLMPVMPAFVAEVYVSVMRYEEESSEPTSLHRSRIMGLLSNRRQDVDHAKWELARQYPEFLTMDFASAVDALSETLRQPEDAADPTIGQLGDRTISVIERAGPWHEVERADQHNPATLLDHFEQHLSRLTDSATAATYLDTVATLPRPASIWRRVIGAAANSEVLAKELGKPGSLIVNWGGTSLNAPLARLIEARFANLSEREREEVELGVIALDPGIEQETAEWYYASERHRRLLYSLDKDLISLSFANETRMYAPPPQRDETSAAWHPVEPYGIDISTEEDQRVWTLVSQVEDFTNAHPNQVPGRSVIDANVEVVQALLATDMATVNPRLKERADDALARSVEVWCRQGADHDERTMELARAIMLRYSSSDQPAARRLNGPEEFSYGPRTHAARGLTALARFEQYANEDMWAAIKRLSSDPVATVRAETIQNIHLLASTNSHLMWDILGERASLETNDGVLGAVTLAAWRLRAVDAQAVDVVAAVASRADRDDERNSAISISAQVAGLIWTLEGDDRAGAVVSDLREQVGPSVLGQMLHEIRQAGCFTASVDAIRQRALDLCAAIIKRGRSEIAGWQEMDESTSEGELTRIRAGLELLATVGSQLAFASGYHDAKQNGSSRPPTADELRFVAEATTMYYQLTGVPHPGLTHQIVESIAFVLDDDPSRALRLVHRCVTTGGRDGGYQLESLAVGEITEIVQRLLADHRAVLQDATMLDALRELLEVFVDVGWPDAHRLAFGLDQIFR